MRLLKTIQKLTLATLLVLALSACSNKDTNDTNATGQTTGTSQGAGEDGAANTGTGGNAGGTTGVSGTESTGTSTQTNTSNEESNANTETSNIVDVTPPVITLNGEANITLEQNENYIEEGATAQDAVDGNVSVSISGNVDTATVGSYTVTYTAQDSAGNEANITRGITVIDVTPPIITLNGEVDMSLFVGDAYVELGATAQDTIDGSVSVNISGEVDTDIEGTYVIMYTAQDNSGNEDNVTRTIRVLTPTVTSLSLSSSNTALNVGETTDLSLEATYSNNTSKTLTNNIEWIVNPTENVEVNGSVLRAKKDGNVTVQASIDGVNSNTIALNITWVVDGHVLPPEPDKALNDSTLLGIDVNDNGVRDDVERWIYEKYKDKHPIHVDIGMQAARGYKLVLETPERAKEITEKVDSIITCEGYYMVYAKYFNEPLLIKERIDDLVEYQYYNTDERRKTYIKYDKLLSGDTYPTAKIDISMKKSCDFDTSKYEE